MPAPSNKQHTHDLQPMGPTAPAKPSLSANFRRILFGKPLANEHMEHTLLPKYLALPVFSSDAISSVAYATQEIALVLGGAGLWMNSYQGVYNRDIMLITGAIVILLAIVVVSYWQTIHGYQNGGGSYIVSKDNLGQLPGLIAAAALLIDYVLTVSVSIASGVQNLSGLPLPPWIAWLHFDHLVLWCLFFIAVLILANLRGLKESGSMFAVFTYGFVIMCVLMIGAGLLGSHFGMHLHTQYVNHVYPGWVGKARKTGGTLGLLLILSAFAQGCSAMTGTEAVSNGIPAFKRPKANNAAWTLVYMGVILGSVFLGISLLVTKLHVVYWEHGTQTADAVIDQLSGTIFGKHGGGAIFYYLTQFFTAAILVIAANTSFADFPRLASILAHDRFMPRQLANLGDKLVYSNGILLLGVFAAVLVVSKNGNVDQLIPLYAIGVFTAFTLSQSGMVHHWFKLRDSVKGWRIKAAINGLGAAATGIVLLDIAAEKFHEGAYWVMICAVVLVWIFTKINQHYKDVAVQLNMANYKPPSVSLKNTVLVMVPKLHRGVMPALEYARSLSDDCRAVHICTDPETTPQLIERWERWGGDVPLIILNSSYRSLIEPIMLYLDAVKLERPNHLITVVIPEFVPTKWWHSLLHGQSAARMKLALLSREDIVVANVRYNLEQRTSPKYPNISLEEENVDSHYSEPNPPIQEQHV